MIFLCTGPAGTRNRPAQIEANYCRRAGQCWIGHRAERIIGVVFVADDLAMWLIAALADAGRGRLTTLVRGTDQERELRQAAAAAVRLTAQDLRQDSEDQAEELAMVISEVFSQPVPDTLPLGQATLLEGLRAGIARQLAVLDDASLTGTGMSSAGVLGIQAGELAEKLTGHLVQQIMIRGVRGGPLFPLASMLGQNAAHLQSQRLEDQFGQLAEEVRDVLAAARLENPGRRSSAEPEKIYVHYTLTLDGELDFDAAAWANALSNERRRMVEAAVGERLDNDFDFYGGQGIAECVEGGELEFTTTTEAEIRLSMKPKRSKSPASSMQVSKTTTSGRKAWRAHPPPTAT